MIYYSHQIYADLYSPRPPSPLRLGVRFYYFSFSSLPIFSSVEPLKIFTEHQNSEARRGDILQHLYVTALPDNCVSFDPNEVFVMHQKHLRCQVMLCFFQSLNSLCFLMLSTMVPSLTHNGPKPIVLCFLKNHPSFLYRFESSLSFSPTLWKYQI